MESNKFMRSVSSSRFSRSVSRRMSTRNHGNVSQTHGSNPTFVDKEEEFIPTELRKPPNKHALDLDSSRFDAGYYVESTFSKKDRPEIETVQKELMKKREECENELKEQIFKEYGHFIDSTNHLHQLKKEITSMRKLFSEQQQSISSLGAICDSNSNTTTEKIKKLQEEDQSSLASLFDPKKDIALNIFDELDCRIAERQFEEAITILEGELNSKVTHSCSHRRKISNSIRLVSSLLCKEIRNPSVKSAECTRIIGYLLRIQESGLACDTFLTTRREQINKVIKDMKVEGDLPGLISHYSQFIFSSISSTSKEFQSIFKDNQMLSAFVTWATDLLDSFGSIISRLILTCGDEKKIKECIEIVHQHCLVLENEGLMLSFYLDKIFRKNK